MDMIGKIDTLEILRQRVKIFCKAIGITQKELAARINMQPDSLIRSLSNNPQFSTLKNIADALGVEVGDLFITGSEVSNPYGIFGTITCINTSYHIMGLPALLDVTKQIQVLIHNTNTEEEYNIVSPKLLK